MYHDPNNVNHSTNFSQSGGGFYDSGLSGSSTQPNNGYNSSSLNDFYSEEAETTPIATNLRPNSTSSSRKNSPKVSSKSSAAGNGSNSGLSREEKTLVELESDIKPKKLAAKKAQPKSLEDEFWAQLEEDSAPKARKK